MSDNELLLWLAPVLSTVVVTVLAGTALLEALGLVRFTGVVVGRENETTADRYGEEYAMAYRRLRQLGFVPLGLVRTRLLPRLEPITKIVFGHPLEHCFVSLFQESDRDPLRVCYTTSFSQGNYLVTAGFSTPSLSTDNCQISGEETRDVEKLYYRHTRAVETFGKGQEPLPTETLGDYLAQERRARHENPSLLALIRADGLANLRSLATSLLIGVALMWLTEDDVRWRLTVGGALGSALYLGHRQMNRYVSHLSRRIHLEEQEEHEDDLWL